MSLKRRYDLGNGATAEDDGRHIIIKIANGSSTRSIGCARFPALPETEVQMVESLDGRYFYVPDFALVNGMHGWWLGKEKYASKEEAEAAAPTGIFGKSTAWFQPKGVEKYGRVLLRFSEWDLKNKPAATSPITLEVEDYIVGVFSELTDQVRRFDEVLAPTGWTYEELLKSIGPWVPINEILVVKLEKAVAA